MNTAIRVGRNRPARSTAPHPGDDVPARAPRTTRRIRAASAVLLTSVLASACGGGGAAGSTPSTPTVSSTTSPATTSPSDTPVTDPDTPLLDALLATRVDGRMPLDGALTAFATLYGGLPGVEPSALAPEGLEGTTAARWLFAHHDELTAEQVAAVDAAMTPLDADGTPLPAGQPPAPTGFRSTSIDELSAAGSANMPTGESGCFGGAFPFADAPGAGKYKDLVRLALAELSLLIGPLDIPVYTSFSEFEGVNADLNPWAPDCDEPAQACQIRLAPLAMQMSDSTLMKTLAHELMHCYQARAIGATTLADMPDWLIEGFPSFVGETVGQSVGSTAPNYWWDKWFKRPGIELYDRTYDALGFYAVVQQAGGDPFGRYITALKTKDSSAAFQELTGGVRDHFGTIWGATHFRQIERGLFWELDGPVSSGYRPAFPTSTITDGGGYASALSEAQAEADVFTLKAEVVVVELTGPVKGRASFSGEADEVLTGAREWCTLGYPCVCPDDTRRAGTVVDQAPGTELAVGAAGIAPGGTLSVTGMTFEDYCGPKTPRTTPPPVPPAVDQCLIGSWTSETWTIPGPPGLGLDLTGGAGISMAINREGLVTTDFSGMATMAGAISQPQSGTATQEITAADGTVDEISTTTAMSLGPGVFAIWSDASRYECDGDTFTLINYDEVESVDISIPFTRD